MSSCNCGISFLPTELFHSIVEILLDGPNKNPLKSCALVCSKWNLTCRLYLFGRIKIINKGRLNDLKELLELKPDVGLHIYELVIQSTPQGKVPEPTAWLADLPLMLSSHLSVVRTIEIVGLWELGDGLLTDFFYELADFRSVTKLVVHKSFVALRMLQALASALPALQELQIGETFPLPAESMNIPLTLNDPCLSSLHLHLGIQYPESIEESLAWALTTRSRTALQSLSLLVYFADATAVTDNLILLGGQLRHLDLHLGISTGSPFEYEMIKDNLHINACTGLQSLALTCTVPACPCMVMLLTEVSSPRIRQISIAIAGDDVAALPDCRALAEPLDGTNLRHLDEVRFMYRGELALHDVLEKLREQLPSHHLRGLLRVVTAKINPCHEPGFPQQEDILGPSLQKRS